MKMRNFDQHISLLWALSILSLLVPGSSLAGSVASADHSKGIQFKRPPLRFEINEGQTDPQVRFTARDRDGVAYLTSDGAVFQISKSVGTSKPQFKKASYTPETRGFESSFVRTKTVGGNPNARAVGIDRLPGVTNYFIGSDPAKWRTNVAGYAKVKYEGVYPGIDLVYYDNGEGRLEYDFIVAPGADPKQIALSIEDAQSVEVDSSGDLIISAATGTIRKPAPKVYQEIDGKRQEIVAGYRLIDTRHSLLGTRRPTLDPRHSTFATQTIAFSLGAYDLNKPLVIDPQILYATYLGGSSTSTIANEGARDVAVDAQGSVYVVGVTISTNFPTKNPAQNVLKGFSNAFVTKLDANGQLVYSTYLGGSGFDEGTVIKVDETGAAYVGGTTGSIDFPAVNPALNRGGRNDGFITKLSPSGSQIVYSTYIGGTDNDSVADLALDAQKNVFVVGNIAPALGVPANDFPTRNPIQATHGGGSRDGFMSKISANGSLLLFSTYLGGDGDDFFQSIAVNLINDDVYLTFFTDSSNFATATSASDALAQATGGSRIVTQKASKEDPLGDIFDLQNKALDELDKGNPTPEKEAQLWLGVVAIRATTNSFFPPDSLQAPQLQDGGGLDVKLTSLDLALNVTKTVFFGGSGEDTFSDLSMGSTGAIYVIGNTRSTDLPVVNPIQATRSGGNVSFEGFLAVFAPGTLQPVFATYLGGIGMEFLTGVTVDPLGNIYVVGETFGNFPNPTPGAIQPQLNGRTDAFIIKISPVEIPDDTLLVSAVLPSSRSVQVGTPATAFATMINAGQSTATSCSVVPITNIPATFLYQTTNSATNQITGTANTPVDVAGGAAQSFVLAFTPTAPFPPTDVQLSFDCTNSNPAPVNSGLNTLLLSASNTPVPDIVALAATTTNDGIANIPGANGTGAFSVATVNVGATAVIMASADTGAAALPVNVFLCETNPTTGACISAIGPSVATTINANATPTFGIFVQGSGNVPFDPAGSRVFVRFKDGGGVTRGSTSVAVRTQ